MKHVLGFQCLSCKTDFEISEVLYTCPACGGNVDVVYDYRILRNEFQREHLAENRNYSMWRYLPMLPLHPETRKPTLHVGWTPIYNLPHLARQFSVHALAIKDEGRNPTASLKDRPSALVAAKALEYRASVATTASSGNAGAAFAAMCNSVDLKSVIFVPQAAPRAKVAQLLLYGATVIRVASDYDHAFDLCTEASRQLGWYNRSTGINAYTAEGKKTAAYEICEQLGWNVPDWVAVSMGDGNIIAGLWKGFKDFYAMKFIGKLPRLLGVQAEGASPIVDAVELGPQGAGLDGIRPVEAHTIADSINVGKPRDGLRAVQAIQESKGRAIKVSDEKILLALARLPRETGVFAEPAGACAYAGFLEATERGFFSSTDSIVIVNTGNGLKDIDSAVRTVEIPNAIPPDFQSLKDHLKLK
ncbi:MAG: threonine synthase [Acidobacteriia bacterium]|nr:threonine synthase [Terriglobia bacterium]